jgi:hypothetical protein
VNISYRSTSGIKLKLRKHVKYYNSDYEGKRKYFDELGLQRELRTRNISRRDCLHVTPRNIHTDAVKKLKIILNINLLQLMHFMRR